MGNKIQQYCLKWSNYQSHIAEICLQSLQSESMVDVTLCAEGHHIHAHRMVLSACSSYFQDILFNCEESHPFVILSEMQFEDIKSIVEFVYRGEINIPSERFTSVLKAAEDLRINGLMEVGNYWPEINMDNNNDITLEVWDSVEEASLLPEDSQTLDIYVGQSDESAQESPVEAQILQEPVEVLVISDKGQKYGKQKKRRKVTSKKEYTEASVAAALEDVKAGRSLIETAAAHHIPRTTLYARARSQNIPIVPSRQEHSIETIGAAVRAVTDGATLQQASDMYKIPKTVLWRRVHKEMGNNSVSRRKMREVPGVERKQAAVMALERGEKVSKVSQEYQIPRTTLFREKTRLVEAGRLPWSCIRKRPVDCDSYKQHRLNEAVTACREGKMSQACASQKFQIPKTTIWRRLRDGKFTQISEGENAGSHMIATESEESVLVDSQLPEQSVFLSEVPSHIPVTYIEETDIADTSLIILTPNNEEDIEAQADQIIVHTASLPHDAKKNAVNFPKKHKTSPPPSGNFVSPTEPKNTIQNR